MLANQRITFIGAGNMAEAMLAGLLHGGRLTPIQFVASDLVQARRSEFTRIYGGTTIAGLHELERGGVFAGH